ncbi:hypothetical protein AGLY_001414 [Aphis glycines]|uniref:Uncharacterized protein n=1 Tax=Aphis glycines TaxID=307491 RepID=A0A6G0U542_APHGL|nr:hypothetical protein AGLY_001414 [Aphis glycines]
MLFGKMPLCLIRTEKHRKEQHSEIIYYFVNIIIYHILYFIYNKINKPKKKKKIILLLKNHYYINELIDYRCTILMYNTIQNIHSWNMWLVFCSDWILDRQYYDSNLYLKLFNISKINDKLNDFSFDENENVLVGSRNYNQCYNINLMLLIIYATKLLSPFFGKSKLIDIEKRTISNFFIGNLYKQISHFPEQKQIDLH